MPTLTTVPYWPGKAFDLQMEGLFRNLKDYRVDKKFEVLREGELEKRSDSLFQLWKKKRGVLTPDRLSLFPAGPGARPKELRFHSILKVDCVERTGKYVYFTIVTTDRKEIDFRCAGESCWNAAITLALIDFQNRRALQDVRRRRERAPDGAEPRAP